MHESLTFAVAVILGMTAVLALAVERPRVLVYLILALCPTQFVFIPVSSFFISPADVLVSAAACAFAIRLAFCSRSSVAALWSHRYLLLMVGAYLLGFLILGFLSRTLVRVLIGMFPSILVCEALRTRAHIKNAATALIFAGMFDAAYGLLMYLLGRPLDPGRFSGMSGLNFSAVVILTAAAMMFARRALARKWTSLAQPGALATIGMATLSQGGTIAFFVSWVVVLRRALTLRNTVRISVAAAIFGTMLLSSTTVRGRLASRNERTVENDGVARNSADVRLRILSVAWTAFSSSPVWGIGYGQFQAFSVSDPDIFSSSAGGGYTTHNTYAEILVEGGILAFLCFSLHFAQYFVGLGKALSQLSVSNDAIAASALVGVPLVLVAAALMNELLVYHFWAVCGLGLAYLRVERHNGYVGTVGFRRHELASQTIPGEC